MGVEGNGAPRFIDLLIAASPMERQKITVAGQEVWIRPLTRAQLADSKPKDTTPRDPDYDALFALVVCAEAEDGSRLFKIADIEAMRTKVSVALMQELEYAMLGVFYPPPKEAEKILNADPPSTTG